MKLSAEESSENKLGEYSVSSTEWGIELKRGRRLIYVYKPGSRSSNSEMNVRGVILELLAADRDRLAAENAELRAGQQTAYENLVKVAKRAKANAARVRELEAALTAFVEAEDINRQYDGTYDSPPGHVVAEMYERAAAMARAALADSGPAGSEEAKDKHERRRASPGDAHQRGSARSAGMNFEVAVFTCARCGEDHTMVFSEFSENPIECDGKVYSHYGTCPNTGEPVILAIVPAGAGEEEA